MSFYGGKMAMRGPSQLLSLCPGLLGDYLRKGFYALFLRRCSPDCTISFGPMVSTTAREIGRSVYIGTHCEISDSIIGAGSVVTKEIPDDSVAVGNPAKVIKSRHVESKSVVVATTSNLADGSFL
jgi:acetyltransferase-like isoleucine patch superfamily enzyme